MGRAGTVVAGTLGAVVTLTAAALVLAPDTVRSAPPVVAATESITTRDPRVVVVAVATLVGLVSLVVSRAGDGRSEDGPGPRLVDRPPEAVAETVGSRPGDAITFRVDRAGDGDDTAAADVEATLRVCAVRALVRERSIPDDQARKAVREGAWTDDSVAAAYLGEPAFPVTARLREWLDPERERQRRVERTVTAVEGLAEGAT